MTDEELELKMREEYHFVPKPVVQTFREKGPGPLVKYFPEVAFGGAHYILAAAQPTHEIAFKIAVKKVAEVRAAMAAAAVALLGGYPRAKE